MTDKPRRWMLIGGIGVLVVVLLAVVIFVATGGSGGHRPRPHGGSDDAGTATVATVPEGDVPPPGAHSQP